MRERSLRIMEALSGVDEELLAGCGIDTGRAAPRHGKVLWRRFGALAAALCLAVIGAAGWGGYRLMRDGGTDKWGSPDVAWDGGQALQESSCLMAADGRETEEAAPEEGEEKVPAEDAAGAGNQELARTEKDSVEDSACAPVEKTPLTLEEARNLEVLGEYVPQLLPEGYTFREAYGGGSGTGSLTVVWGNGTDSIILVIREGGDSVSVADVDRPETYDQRLYEIPYGETVPEEFRETFLDPVFAWEDFGLEVIRSRMVSDGGDNTSVGHFKVLYPQGVLLDFNGSGTVDEIWEMFRSVEGEV